MGHQHEGVLWQLPEEAGQKLWTEYVSLMRELYVQLNEFETSLFEIDMELSDFLFGDAFFQK